MAIPQVPQSAIKALSDRYEYFYNHWPVYQQHGGWTKLPFRLRFIENSGLFDPTATKSKVNKAVASELNNFNHYFNGFVYLANSGCSMPIMVGGNAQPTGLSKYNIALAGNLQQQRVYLLARLCSF